MSGSPDRQDPFEQERARLGDVLQLGRAVPEAVFVAAVQDADYARNLYLCRNTPALIAHLLEHPPAGKQDAAEQSAAAAGASTVELVRAASTSFWAWTKTGFRAVDEATYARRMAACAVCPNLIDRPNRAVYALAAPRDGKICAACGCPVAAKARRPHENCPVADPENPELSRWGEVRSPGG